MDGALLLLRLVVGLYLFGHGAQKLFGWFGGPGLKGATAGMSALRFRPAPFWALIGALSETAGGLLFALGLLSPLGALGIAAAMLVAILAVHWHNGVWAQQGGYELPLTNLAVAAAGGLTGPGRFSLDAALGIALPEPATLLIGTARVVVGVLAARVSRETAATAAETPQPGG